MESSERCHSARICIVTVELDDGNRCDDQPNQHYPIMLVWLIITSVSIVKLDGDNTNPRGMTTLAAFHIIPRPYASLQLRHHRPRRRACGLCGGHSRGAA